MRASQLFPNVTPEEIVELPDTARLEPLTHLGRVLARSRTWRTAWAGRIRARSSAHRRQNVSAGADVVSYELTLGLLEYIDELEARAAREK